MLVYAWQCGVNLPIVSTWPGSESALCEATSVCIYKCVGKFVTHIHSVRYSLSVCVGSEEGWLPCFASRLPVQCLFISMWTWRSDGLLEQLLHPKYTKVYMNTSLAEKL